MERPFCGFEYLMNVNVGESISKRNINVGINFLFINTSVNLLKGITNSISFSAKYCSNCKRIYEVWELNNLNNIDLDTKNLDCKILKCYIVIPIISINPFQRYKS